MNHNIKKSLSHYRVIPRTVKIGVPEAVSIYPLGKSKKFSDDIEYTVKFIPMECYEQAWITEPKFDFVKVHPKDGVITVTYTFDEEQEWSLVIFSDNEREAGKKPLEFRVYSLYDDLYERNPYRGDLHVHSNASDGQEDPLIVAANYRKEGFDFFALTDHHLWNPSDEMCRAYENIPLGIKMFRGEEVHVPTAWIHIVNFGSDYSVNELYHKNEAEIDEMLKKEAEELNTPKGVNALDYAYRRWITNEIRRAGGLSIVPHPYWITRNSYNMSDRTLEYVFETGAYDAFELIGGQTLLENNIQSAFYQEMRAKGMRIPIVGSSDSHGTDPASYFGIGKTIVFAPDMKKDSICNAIKDMYSVAIEKQYNDGGERVYGSYRLVKYTMFLLDNYFPSHDELCIEEGVLMREYSLGYTDAGTKLSELCNRTEKNMKYILKGIR